MVQKKKRPGGFTTFHEHRSLLEKLSDKDCGKLYNALLDYSEHGIQPDFKDGTVLNDIFEVMAACIDEEREE